MMKYQALNDSLSALTNATQTIASPSDQVHALTSALNVIREIIKILDPENNKLIDADDILENIIPNTKFANYKIESWFSEHPIYPSERTALYVYDNDICEMKFYWLNENSTKARISAGVMMSPNWEDRDSTRNDSYKVGIDFFLKRDCKSLLMVISNHGKLRVMEFSDRLTHTQVEILQKISGCLGSGSKQTLHSMLWGSMALSEVNKHFYEGIAQQFSILHQHLIASGRNKDDAKLFASRLIGRLLFIWFLRKKGAIPYDEKYFPINIDDSTDYYNNVLRDLFFATFNTPLHARRNGDNETPYLNGGLFDAHENDWAYERISFPPNFFNDLFDHLNKYNFTTDESSPEYEQVAIDPEMLGRVFESLLAEQTTETGEQARKAKGAFYTPREIVSYMCKESLRQYLYSQLKDPKYYGGVDKLLDSPDYEWETAHSNAKRDLWPFEDTNTIVARVIGILDSLTVLDPACGSGAFPMGMLQLLTKIYERLDSRFDQYKTKLSIIQNNIFGVDVEPMAVEISRLRAWLAIIVDDRGEIDPLPNLDFKFVCADSLMPLTKSIGLWSDPTLQEKMSELRNKFFNARKPETKEKYKNDYYKLANNRQTSMFNDKRDAQLKSFDPFKNQHPAQFCDTEYMFGVDKFDIVIGNPPYVDYRKIENNSIKNIYRVAAHSKMINLYIYFFEYGLNKLKDGGSLCYISPQQYLILDNCKGLRDITREYTYVILSDFSMAEVFDASTYPFVSLIKKVPASDSLVFREYVQTQDLNNYTRELLIQNPIPEPVNISKYGSIISRIERNLTLEDYTDDIFVASSSTQKRLPSSEGQYSFIEASDIKEYYIDSVKSSISPNSKEYSSLSMKKQFSDIVVTSRMTSTIRAAIVNNSTRRYLGGKINVVLPRLGNEKILVALLNSKVVNFWFREKFGMTHMQGGALPINAADLKKIPIPRLKDKSAIIEELVDEIIKRKSASPDADIESLQRKIDLIICQAYELDKNEIETILQ